jgi:NADH-quinone oxidoreductase subunit L
MYGKKSLSRAWLSSKMPFVVSVLQNKFYIDELYEYTVVYATRAGSLFLQFMEWFLVEGIVKGITVSIRLLAKLGAKMQNGQTQSYGVVAFVGLALLVVIYALTGGYIK